MTKALTKHLESIATSGKGIFVPYIMARDHEKALDGLFGTITFLENSGASAIEVGIPWSDSAADGPVVELAGQRSLVNGVNLTAVVQKLQEKQTTVPLVVMIYINPIYQYGIEKFIANLKNTSVKGLIVSDLPHERENMVKPYLTDTDTALVPLASLTTGIERQKTLCKDVEGFIYTVAINGVTGKAGNYRDNLDRHLTNLKAIADIPVLTGFSVSAPADVERFNKASDGIIVGMKIVRDLHEGKTDDVAGFVKYGSDYQK